MTERAVTVHNSTGQHAVLLVCEHASAFMPQQFGNLGLDPAAAVSHVAWDPGAVATARQLANQLDARLIEGAVSRLIYDCNRPPHAADAMPSRSELYDIPGNANLSAAQRQARVDQYYRPFETQLEQALRDHPCPAVLVTLHSFTPVYHGVQRELDIGILHDEDSRLADALLEVASGYNIQRNAPYGPQDGVTHTLQLHGIANGLPNVMIEIRNDLIRTDQQCADMAVSLATWLDKALLQLSRTSSSPGAAQ